MSVGIITSHSHSAQWRAAPDCRAPPSPIVTHNSLCDVVGGRGGVEGVTGGGGDGKEGIK